MYLSMALQSFVRPWPLFNFLILYTVGRIPWTGDQPVAHTEQHKHRYPCLEWDSHPRSQRSSRAKTVHASDRAAIVISGLDL
jgi:hypothetical protein